MRALGEGALIGLVHNKFLRRFGNQGRRRNRGPRSDTGQGTGHEQAAAVHGGRRASRKDQFGQHLRQGAYQEQSNNFMTDRNTLGSNSQ